MDRRVEVRRCKTMLVAHVVQVVEVVGDRERELARSNILMADDADAIEAGLRQRVDAGVFDIPPNL